MRFYAGAPKRVALHLYERKVFTLHLKIHRNLFDFICPLVLERGILLFSFFQFHNSFIPQIIRHRIDPSPSFSPIVLQLFTLHLFDINHSGNKISKDIAKTIIGTSLDFHLADLISRIPFFNPRGIQYPI